jgi:cytochrome c-type biogenesis protein CcmH/NrfF
VVSACLGSARPACAALALALALAGAAAGEPRGWAQDLGNELMSPYCPGRTLAECPSDQAQTLRMWLAVQEANGRGEGEVMQELVARYGEQIRGAPRPRGFGLAAYVLPVVAFVAGGLLLVRMLRRHTQRARTAPADALSARPIDPEIERLVDEELAR